MSNYHDGAKLNPGFVRIKEEKLNGTAVTEQSHTHRPSRPGLEERKDPVLFKFERPGQLLEGHLAGIVKAVIEGKPGVDLYFCVNEKTDQLVKIHATYQLMQKIRSGDTGRFVSIMFEGADPSIRNMRRFSVMVDRKNEPRPDLVMESALLETMAE